MCTLSEPTVAFEGFDRVIITVSSASSSESSSMLAIVMVPVVSPADMVSVPLAKV